jgi:tetratricopeptide (TPR) repeat protein
VTLNPHQAFSWDHFALYNLYTGDLDQALQASKNAVLLGSYSPLRFAYETTLSMVSTLAGDFRTAIYYGERALDKQPRYQPVKRYLVAAHASSGGQERAETLLADLKSQDAELSLDSVKRDSFALMREDDKSTLISAFRQAGLR